MPAQLAPTREPKPKKEEHCNGVAADFHVVFDVVVHFLDSAE